MNYPGSWHKHFSHIYVEEAARGYAWTERILRRFPKAERIGIGDYKEVFGRAGQDFQLQKQSMKLILAVKKDHLLYRGSENAQDFGQPNFHYNALILNCLYNCDYCYLQGMYPSGNVVAFVNLEDYFEATRKAVARRKEPGSPLYLAISYDTDLLGFEPVAPYCREWVEFSRKEPDLLIEIRTKSANFKALEDVAPHPRAILAWTLSPEPVAKVYEKLTPSLDRRLEAAGRALGLGWPVRLCFDPMLKIPGWREAYTACVEKTFARLPGKRIRDASVGVFRMNGEYFKRMKKLRDDTDVLYYPYERENKIISYSRSERSALTAFMEELLQNHISKENIVIWT